MLRILLELFEPNHSPRKKTWRFQLCEQGLDWWENTLCTWRLFLTDEAFHRWFDARKKHYSDAHYDAENVSIRWRHHEKWNTHVCRPVPMTHIIVIWETFWGSELLAMLRSDCITESWGNYCLLNKNIFIASSWASNVITFMTWMLFFHLSTSVWMQCLLC